MKRNWYLPWQLRWHQPTTSSCFRRLIEWNSNSCGEKGNGDGNKIGRRDFDDAGLRTNTLVLGDNNQSGDVDDWRGVFPGFNLIGIWNIYRERRVTDDIGPDICNTGQGNFCLFRTNCSTIFYLIFSLLLFLNKKSLISIPGYDFGLARKEGGEIQIKGLFERVVRLVSISLKL